MHIYEEFKDVNIANEKFFEFITNTILIQFLEKMHEDETGKSKDLKWVIAFPSCIPSDGRSIIHEVGSYFGLASHSEGGKKNRRAIIYPRTLYKEKQEQEKRKIEKDLEKIREKHGGKAMIGIAYDNPRSMRDKMLKLVFEESKSQRD